MPCKTLLRRLEVLHDIADGDTETQAQTEACKACQACSRRRAKSGKEQHFLLWYLSAVQPSMELSQQLLQVLVVNGSLKMGKGKIGEGPADMPWGGDVSPSAIESEASCIAMQRPNAHMVLWVSTRNTAPAIAGCSSCGRSPAGRRRLLSTVRTAQSW